MQDHISEPAATRSGADILAAAKQARERMDKYLHGTPIVESTSLSGLGRCSILLKAENFQRTGSYKPRTAFNSLLSARERGNLTQAGVVGDSSGNFAQALALAARTLGVTATIIVPETTNPLKVAACYDYGATIISKGITWDNRRGSAAEFARNHDVLLVDPDSWDGIAGDGTLSLEIAEQVDDFDTVLIPVSTGGLIAGVATVMKQVRPEVRVIGVQPELSGHARRSLLQDRIDRLPSAPATIADGARNLALGERPFSLIRQYVDEVVLVTEEEILTATWHIMTRAKLVVEPTGALATAAILAGRVSSNRAVCIVSGGNADLADLGSRFAVAGLANSRQRVHAST